MNSSYFPSKKLIIYYTLVSFIICFFHSLFFRNDILSIILAILETLLIIVFLIKGNVEKFILWMILFSSSVIENPTFTTGNSSTELYNFLNIPFFRFYHLFLLIFVAFLLINKRNGKIYLKNDFANKIVYVYIYEFLLTWFTYLINDNGIRTGKALLRFILQDIYNSYFVVFIVVILLRCLQRNMVYLCSLKSAVIGFFIGVSLSSMCQVILGNYHSAGETMNLITPLSFFFSPMLVLFIFQNGRQYVFPFFLGIISIVIQIKYSTGIPGAFWLYILFLLIYIFFRFINRNEKRKSKMYVFLITLFLLFFLAIMHVKISNSYVLYKLQTLIDIFHTRGSIYNWYSGLGHSIGVRIETFVNIFIEWFKKPFFFLFGKGFGGSILHIWGSYDWNSTRGTYPPVMMNLGVYSWFHTEIAEILINFGLLGIYLIYKLIKFAIESLHSKSGDCYMYVGVIWILLLPISFHTMIIGVICLAIGLYEESIGH